MGTLICTTESLHFDTSLCDLDHDPRSKGSIKAKTSATIISQNVLTDLDRIGYKIETC